MKKKIKSRDIKTRKSRDTLIKANDSHKELGTLVFSFEFFQPRCIKIDGFNNYFEDGTSAHKSTSDLMQQLIALSCKTKSEVFSNSFKQQLHLNKINDNKTIDFIELVLREGYHIPERTIKEFEREYFEMTTHGDGGRLFFILVVNTIKPLFLDSNHMVFKGASRQINKKDKYNHPGFLNFTN